MLTRRRPWTAADDAALTLRYPQEPTAAIALDLRRSIGAVYQRADILGLSKSAEYLASPAACRLRKCDGRGGPTRFTKGHTPANKGLRRPGWGPGRMKSTQFRKGHGRSGVAVALYKPIGTERVSKDGYRERKVNDAMPLQSRWRAVHLILWEAANGPVPKGFAVCFQNGDKTDIRLDNLVLVARRDLMKRNSVHNLPAPLPQTIQLLGALKRAIRRKTRHVTPAND